MKIDFRNRNISIKASLIDALKQMDQIDHKLLLVLDNKKFVGLVSIGDLQRAIINNKPLNTPLASILRKEIKTGSVSDSESSIKDLMLKYRMEFCPVISKEGEIENIYFWEDLFEDSHKSIVQFDVPVVIMAGGYGTRLRPLTNVLPKPLIPIGAKTMLEEIFDRFSVHGCKDFYISVNYKAELIEYYIKALNLPLNINFFKEDKPLGTAGSLTLLNNLNCQRFFVNNCDILIEQDYADILDFHLEQKNEITVVAALKSYAIPYGTIESGANGQLIELKEKPQLTFKINSGMYLLESTLLKEIPQGEFFHITDLIDKIINRGGRVGVFPVSEKAWKDIGDWPEYLQIIKAND